MKKSMNWLAAICMALALTACGKSLDGKYKDQLGIQTYEFKSDGKVYMSTMGITQEAKYSVEDGKVKIIQPDGGNIIFDLKDDGTISGPLGMELKKEGSK
jgi:outer membrane lipopolysaccharide assembly protein LptE/RlpB